MLIVISIRRILHKPLISRKFHWNNTMIIACRVIQITIKTFILLTKQTFWIICRWHCLANAISLGSFSGLLKLIVIFDPHIRSFSSRQYFYLYDLSEYNYLQYSIDIFRRQLSIFSNSRKLMDNLHSVLGIQQFIILASNKSRSVTVS